MSALPSTFCRWLISNIMYNILSGMLKLQAEALKGTDHQQATPLIARLDENKRKIEPPNSSNNHNWVLSLDSRTSQSSS